MGVRGSLVRKVVRGGQLRWVIDFRFLDKDGKEQRYRRDAAVQSANAAHAEANRLRALAVSTGTLEVKRTAPTFSEFVRSTFEPLYLPKYRPATQVRYKALFGQGILTGIGATRLDNFGALTLRTYGAALLERGI